MVMGKPSISSPTSSDNVRFYSSSGTMGNYNGNSRFCQGPRRVCCFCLLAVITPALFVSIVLLMRFVFNGTATYHINPSDMRILDHKISTTWCQSETIKMNTTFTAYLTDGEPRLVKAPAPLTTTKTLLIPDDHKEYWGFYLLKGSTFRIRTCARHKGGTLLIVKGRSHLHLCAYIGEADSAGDSDEFSNSASVEDPNGTTTKNGTETLHKLRQILASQKGTSTEEMSMILARIRAFIRSRPVGYTKLQEQLSNWMLLDPKLVKNSGDSETEGAGNSLKNTDSNPADVNEGTGHRIRHAHAKQRHEKQLLERLEDEVKTASNTNAHLVGDNEAEVVSTREEHGTIRRQRRSIDIRKKSESGENGAFEDSSEDPDSLPLAINSTYKLPPRGNHTSEFQRSHSNSSEDTSGSIWKKEHSHHTGTLNDSNPYQAIDGSNSESESSFSSSEEALARCEGVVASLYLKPSPSCGSEETVEDIPIFYESVVNSSGYYYFIFGSENEKRDNFIRARFELEKYIYELPQPVPNCTDVTECRVDFTFWSTQKLVVQIPQPSPERESVWDEVYVAESTCEPRALLYLIFVIIVPISIILCAFH